MPQPPLREGAKIHGSRGKVFRMVGWITKEFVFVGITNEGMGALVAPVVLNLKCVYKPL